MSHQQVHVLELAVGKAVADVLRQQADEGTIPLMPREEIIHLMAKAAVTVLEAAESDTAPVRRR